MFEPLLLYIIQLMVKKIITIFPTKP